MGVIMKCPYCNEKNRIYFREHWTKKYMDFACGKCKLQLEIPKSPLDYQILVNEIFDFVHIDPIRTKVDNMTEEEKLQRLEELKKRT